MGPGPMLDALLDPRESRGLGGRFYGVHVGVVVDVVDPESQGRVRVRLPWSPDSEGAAFEAWARLATLMAGADRGSWFVPDVDDEVLVAFEAGEPRRPYVIGALWNGRDAPPESMDSAGKNEKKVLRSRNGVAVTLDDAPGRESLTLETPAGQSAVLKDGPGTIEIRDANGNSVKLDPAGVTVTSAGKVTVNASVLELTAGSVTINAGMASFSGVVQATTVIATSVVSSSYSPGAGNLV